MNGLTESVVTGLGAVMVTLGESAEALHKAVGVLKSIRKAVKRRRSRGRRGTANWGVRNIFEAVRKHGTCRECPRAVEPRSPRPAGEVSEERRQDVATELFLTSVRMAFCGKESPWEMRTSSRHWAARPRQCLRTPHVYLEGRSSFLGVRWVMVVEDWATPAPSQSASEQGDSPSETDSAELGVRTDRELPRRSVTSEDEDRAEPPRMLPGSE